MSDRSHNLAADFRIESFAPFNYGDDSSFTKLSDAKRLARRLIAAERRSSTEQPKKEVNLVVQTVYPKNRICGFLFCRLFVSYKRLVSRPGEISKSRDRVEKLIVFRQMVN